jgi:hypothetical protein
MVAYTKEQREALVGAVAARFGEVSRCIADEGRIGPKIDILAISPQKGRNYYTLVTCGCGAARMHIPPGLVGDVPDRAELVFTLPPDWDIAGTQPADAWPLHWLRILGKLPQSEKSWLGWGHTIPNGEPFAENTALSAILLLDPFLAGQDDAHGDSCTLPDGETVAFFQIFPLYEEELAFKLAQGTDALLTRFGQGLQPVLELARPNACAPQQEPIPPQAMPAFEEPDFQALDCLFTRRVDESGAVGYCYREAPRDSSDSGWRFLCGDESQAYMDEPDNAMICSLKDFLAHCPNVADILPSPAPCSFAGDGRTFVRLKPIGNASAVNGG